MKITVVRLDSNDHVLWAFILFAIFLVVILRGLIGNPGDKLVLAEPSIGRTEIVKSL